MLRSFRPGGALWIVGGWLFISLAAVSPGRAEIAPSSLWPLPAVPEGGNPVETAAPRMDWVVRFGETLARTKGKHYDLVFDGDSITDFWQDPKRGKPVWDARYAPLNAVDFGVAGDRVENVLWRLAQGQGAEADPKLVVLMVGTNNLALNTPDEIAGGIRTLVAAYLAQCPHARLLLLGIFPRGGNAGDPLRAKIAAINPQLAKLDDGLRVTYLDIGAKFLEPDGTLTKEVMPDALHPGTKGYRIWADAIEAEVEKTFPGAPKGNAVPAVKGAGAGV